MMQPTEQRVVYDLEIGPNRTIIGIKAKDAEPVHLDVTKPITADVAAEIYNRLNNGREVVGYNNSGFDTYLLDAVLKGNTPAFIHKVAQKIIKTDEPAWKIAQDHGLKRSEFNELDLMNYTPRGRLKQYEGRLGLRIVDLPFDPEQPIGDDKVSEVVAYLEHDLIATEQLRDAVEKDVQARRILEDLFDVPGLTKKTPANVAASIIVSEYLRENHDIEESWIKAQARQMRDCAFDFYVPQWVRDGIKGTVAETIADQIDGTEFVIKDGVRQVLAREWPSVIRLSDDDGLDLAFGLGGIHSKDEACNYSGVSFDVASLYPHIIMHPECSPGHLDTDQFHRIYGQLIERRMQAKRSGDKATSDALKLVLNSCFGAFNYSYSPLYSPESFLRITVSGQLCLIALADKLTNLKAAA
jgi:hypothetical protein